MSRSNARDMQLLVRLLGIDPENVRVEALEENAKKRLTQTTLTSSMGLVVKQQNPVSGKNVMISLFKIYCHKKRLKKLMHVIKILLCRLENQGECEC